MRPIQERARPWLGDSFPQGWHLTGHNVALEGEVNEIWVWDRGQRRVIVTDENHPDGRRWLHASISTRRGRIRYEDLLYLRRHWLGPDWPALQMFPTQEGYVNLHENCLHLWVCLTEDPEWVQEKIQCAASAYTRNPRGGRLAG